MGSAGTNAENWILDAMLGDGHTANFANTVYVALFTVSPTSGGGGSEVGTSGTNYSRVGVANNSTNWPNAASSVKTNGLTIQFPDATTDWGAVTSYAIFDSSSGGSILVYGDLDVTRSINAGTSPFFAPGDLILRAV